MFIPDLDFISIPDLEVKIQDPQHLNFSHLLRQDFFENCNGLRLWGGDPDQINMLPPFQKMANNTVR
jgi:hypothetical protein